MPKPRGVPRPQVLSRRNPDAPAELPPSTRDRTHGPGKTPDGSFRRRRRCRPSGILLILVPHSGDLGLQGARRRHRHCQPATLIGSWDESWTGAGFLPADYRVDRAPGDRLGMLASQW